MDGVIRHARIARLLRARHGLVWMGSKRLRRQGVSVGMHKDGRKPPLRSSGDRLATSVGKLTAPLHFPFLVSSCAQDEPVPPPFVFVNFNKNDKLEPVSFGLWLRILRRTTDERSLLWLLRPSERLATGFIEENLRKVAAAGGVDPRRLIFAERTPKHAHLARHVAGDLFLDVWIVNALLYMCAVRSHNVLFYFVLILAIPHIPTNFAKTFFYGAHSTATDALRGGLPVLTCPGDAFARRVGVSLLENTCCHHGKGEEEVNFQRHLITHSVREFEDLAVRLAKEHRSMDPQLSGSNIRPRHSANLLSRLQAGLMVAPLDSLGPHPGEGNARNDYRLFGTAIFTATMERACALMWEVFNADKRGISHDLSSNVELVGTPPLSVRRHIAVGGG